MPVITYDPSRSLNLRLVVSRSHNVKRSLIASSTAERNLPFLEGFEFLVLHLDTVGFRIVGIDFPFERVHAALGRIGGVGPSAVQLKRCGMTGASETVAGIVEIDEAAQMRTNRREDDEEGPFFCHAFAIEF